MFTSERLTKALLFAIEAHGDQKRLYTLEPYICHPIRVAALLPPTTDVVVAAALNHDVLEDTAVFESDMRAALGDDVTNLVLEVTNVSKKSDGNRAVRKELDRLHLAKASDAGKIIKLADLIDNTESIAKHDKGFAKVYIPEKLELLKVLRPNFDPTGLWGRAAMQASQVQAVLEGVYEKG